MKPQKLNPFQKIWLKLTKPRQYMSIKIANEIDARHASFQQVISELSKTIYTPKTQANFKHAGNSGDIIYSLPIVAALAQKTQATYYLQIDQHGDYPTDHPLGNVKLNRKMAEMLFPLLRSQPYLHSVEIYDNQAIDYDLDIFRESPLLLDRGDIARWYFYVFNAFYDLSQAWLTVTPDLAYQDTIVLARSERYQNPYLDYSFLKKYKNVVFVGVEKEYTLMKAVIPNLTWKPVGDFLELARIIAGSKFFIGNQSFPFSIAEGLKARRILEMSYECPNVIVHGKNGYDVYFQQRFEELVQRLWEE